MVPSFGPRNQHGYIQVFPGANLARASQEIKPDRTALVPEVTPQRWWSPGHRFSCLDNGVDDLAELTGLRLGPLRNIWFRQTALRASFRMCVSLNSIPTYRPQHGS